MESNITELRTSAASHSRGSAIMKCFDNTASCSTRTGQHESQYLHQHNDSLNLENSQVFSAKLENQKEDCVTEISVPKIEQSCIRSLKFNTTDSSVASSTDSVNPKSNSEHIPLGTRNLEKRNNPYFKMPTTPDDYDALKRKKVDLYGPDVGPKMYNVKGNLVTPPIIAKNLPEIFNVLPIFGRPASKDCIEEFYSQKIREFVGCDLNAEQFQNLANDCSPDLLRSGCELRMPTLIPTMSVTSEDGNREYNEQPSNLCIVRKHRVHVAGDLTLNYQKKLKYRGIRLMPLAQTEDSEGVPEPDLEPGKDIIYVVRIYRPFPYNIKEKHVSKTSSRHSVFSRSLVLVGRQRLSALRERIVCANDVGVRLDVSAAPRHQPAQAAKELFPSGFLFINNVFYVDSRAGCGDRSAGLRAWARARGLGHFEARDLHQTRLRDLTVRLGHPEVYIHQGNCEHLFTFSEIRLLNPDDPLSIQQYPVHTAVSQNQTVYCTTCAEFGAKWIVTNCSTVPFDPAYFCDTCFKLFLYKDGEKIGEFKAFSYRGNEINMLKPSG